MPVVPLAWAGVLPPPLAMAGVPLSSALTTPKVFASKLIRLGCSWFPSGYRRFELKRVHLISLRPEEPVAIGPWSHYPTFDYYK